MKRILRLQKLLVSSVEHGAVTISATSCAFTSCN